ncbi:MAG: AAA family ATPase [Candidatus Aminicenantes bacterium]|nr:AAA family ATPase [Candidatus Aminicenantes bacterium]
MKRDLKVYLDEWKNDPDKKPIILKGARQVGKSYLARDFGKSFENFVEINFEFEPRLKSLFDRDFNPERIIRDLSIAAGKKITPGKTLLFFDEIQECSAAIKSLRYFYEKMPGLHLVAAGSLLDFVLENIGLPVGRVIPLYLYPLSFMEFLSAAGHENLREEISVHEPGEELAGYIHDKLLTLLGEYLAVGGMPEAVEKWLRTGDLKACMNIHQQLVETYRQDFARYTKEKKQGYVELVFNSIPRLSGKKFIFHSVSPDIRSRELKSALELLSKAGIAHIIYHSSANGLPLGAEVNPLISKVIFLDTALSQSVLGIDCGSWIIDPVRTIVNRGAAVEAFVGQELMAYSQAAKKNDLYYWVCEKRGSQAEIDYVTTINGNIVPVEVKSGKTGSLKSMHLFLENKKNSTFGIQFSQKNYNIDKRIMQYPLYAISAALNTRKR